ncbi:MFS general substrate transporter [Ganoderma sinense ZZ0214-1]|uniref:MFS general substrate transporter n=1 Tax=Ganoderma sinense ZZ0214-1 TaxID=1077348 RepID=A0A2G8SBM6_9APHY|nr:MFS general substrate transporter [Ganoderma sinense ZZ0214-1]
MAFGILDDHKLDNVPGTGLLSDKTSNQMTAEEARGLKRGAGKHSHIVLIPQPSDDPRDPLNWPRWKKEACFWTIVFTTTVSDALWSIARPAYVQLSKEFHVSIDEVASSFSSNLLGFAAFTLVQNPFAIKYGHRVVYIVSSLLLGFWFMSIACGLSFVAVFFFAPETTYKRNSVVESTKHSDVQIHNNDSHRHGVESLSPATYLSQLKIYNGTFSNESVFKIFLQPLPFVLSPMTLFALICYCIPTSLLALVSQCASTIFTIEYGFNTVQIGLTSLTGVVGIALAMLVTGPFNDWVIIQMSRRNRGIYEPEYRLVFMHSMVIAVLAYAGWAIGNDRHMPWIGAAACMTMLYLSVFISWSPPFTYLIDTHGTNAAHIIVLLKCAKNILSYGATFFANRVILAHGVKATLLVFAACHAACWLASVVMYVFGKRVRSFVARHPRLFGGDLPERDLPQSKSKQ